MANGLFGHVLENLGVGLAVLDRQSRIVAFNSWLSRATGVRTSRAVGRLWEEVFPDASNGRLAHALGSALNDGQSVTLLHAVGANALPVHWDARARAEGKRFPHDIQVLPLAFENERYCLLQVTDVSLAMAREQRLTDSVAEARKARSAQREFLARMSHEIRTPMNGVIALCELLLMEGLSPEHRETLEVIHDSSHSLLGIINDVLDFSKIDAGKMTIHKEVTDVRKLVRGVEAVLGPRARDKRVAVRLEVPNDVPALLVIDELRTRQVLLNFLTNAIKFTGEQGEVAISINWTVDESGDGTLRFGVRDTGIGVAEPERLFRDYAQADATISQRFGGTGLGLSISKHLVELMGGRIGVESVLGVGSHFWFDMPAAKGSVPVDHAPISATVVKVGGRVLVVDDNRVNQLVATKILQQMGYHVATADNGLLALDAMAREHFDVVFMDCLMPVMDGYEATKELRARGFTATPIVAVTAGAVEGDREACMQAGMTDYVTKPLTIGAVSSLLERLRTNTAPASPNEHVQLRGLSLRESCQR